MARSKGSERFNAIRDLVIAQSRLRDWSGALQTVELEENPRVQDSLLHWVGLAKAQAGDFEGAIAIANAHPDFANREGLLVSAVGAAAEQGHFERAFSIAEGIPSESGHWVNALGWIALAQMKNGDIQGALETAGQVGKENAYTWSSVFRAYAMSGDLAEVVKKSKGIPEYWEQGYAQLGIVWGRLEIDDIDGAKTTAEFIEWVHARGLAFLAIAKNQIEKGLLDDARQNLKKALPAVLKMPPGWVRGDALWQLAKVQAEGNDIQGARLTAGEIQPGGHRDSALRDIAQVQVENGDFAGALRTADGFQGFAFPNPFHLIIHEQIRHGDLDGAMSTALKIPEKFRTAALAQVSLYKAKPGEIQDILKSLSAFSSEEKDEFMPTVVEELAQARQYEQAMAIIAAINLPYLQSLTLERVARVQIKYQEWELAKATGARSGNVRIYQELALAWSQSGKMPEALDWVGHLSDPFAKTYGLIGITEALDISTKKMDSSFR